MTIFPIDAWTTTHLFGSYFLVKAVLLPIKRRVRSAKIVAASIALMFGLIWELLDELNIVHLDPRGGDWGDIIADGIGCALSLVI